MPAPMIATDLISSVKTVLLSHRGVCVKAHRDVADQQSPQVRHNQPLGVFTSSPSASMSSSDSSSWAKCSLKSEAQQLRHGLVIQAEIAHEAHDRRAAQLVFVGHEVAPAQRQLAGVQRPVVVRQVFVVLPVEALRLGDRRHAEGVNIRPAARAVALEIPLQRLLPLRQRQLVARARKVVHADIHVALGSEPLDRQLEQLQLGFRRSGASRASESSAPVSSTARGRS